MGIWNKLLGKRNADESRQEQISISTDNLMTSQLAALYLDENKIAYKNMYKKRLRKLGIGKNDIEKLFEFECNIIKTFNKVIFTASTVYANVVFWIRQAFFSGISQNKRRYF